MRQIHDFHEQLKQSQAPELTKRLDRWLAARFKCVRIERRTHDREFQFAGMDLIVYLRDGSQTTVEEKIRPGPKVYPDFLLETVSNDVTHTPGWAVKPFAADWLLYYQQPIDKIWLFPGNAVRKAVARYITEWKQHYIEKPNNKPSILNGVAYRSWNVAVPEVPFLVAIDEAQGSVACSYCGTLVKYSDLRFWESKGELRCFHCETW